jgi:ribosomal protein S18 acetylase RimI-like enzyme
MNGKVLAPRMMIDIRPAVFPTDRDAVCALFREYAEGLGIDLSFQRFDEEVEALPGAYEPPRGRLLIALRDEAIVGCVALRPLDDERCEMKRLYLRPGARGTGLGRRLVEAICAEARASGYRTIVLDTLPTLAAAQAVYRALGFVATAPYVFNPVAGAQYLALDLTSSA